MADEENYQPYHVPQQSRRDKLRIMSQIPSSSSTKTNIPPLLSHYDLSLLPSDLLTCASNPNHMAALVGSSPTMSFLDLHSSLPINPNDDTLFSYTQQNLQNFKDFGQSFNTTDYTMLLKPDTTHQALSLSLSSHKTKLNSTNSNTDSININNNSNQGFGVGSSMTHEGFGVPNVSGDGGGGCSEDRSVLPLGPLTGYATILKRSKFLKPAQQLLEEIYNMGRVIYADKIDEDLSFMEEENINARNWNVDDGENRRYKSTLISMLDEVYRRYKLYYQQMEAVVSSFEYVAGLGNAAPYANLALQTLSKHFKCLKNAIVDQLQFTNKTRALINTEGARVVTTDKNVYGQRQHLLLDHQPVWRPQRGLPERAVHVLRAWLFDHFLHPYPTDTDKLMLAKQTGLSRNQVSNWFINARVRLWKPMVEEIHLLEKREAHKISHSQDLNTDLASSTSTRVVQSNGTEFPDHFVPQNEQPPVSSYNNLHIQSAHSNNNVSLTLGLHQNNSLGLGSSESYPFSTAQRFGLVESSNHGEYVTIPSRHVIPGDLLHDFVN